MKVVLDLIEVIQRWNPDNDEYLNIAIIAVGHEVLEIAVTTEQVQALISTAAQQNHAPRHQAPEPQEEPEYDEPTRVFGGDLTQQAALFQPYDEPGEALDTSALPEPGPKPRVGKSAPEKRLDMIQESRKDRPIVAREERKKQMRARAAKVPYAKIAQDEMGYPVLSKSRKEVEAPVIRHTEIHTDMEDGDDIFEQG